MKMIAYDRFGNLRAPMKGAHSAVKREERDSSKRRRAAGVRALRRVAPGNEEALRIRVHRSAR